MKFILNEENLVIGCEVNGEVSHYDTHYHRSPLDECELHLEHASKIVALPNVKLTSVIIYRDQLDPALSEDPKYARLEYNIGVSHLQSDAIRRLHDSRSYPSPEEVEALLTSMDIPLTKGNVFTDEENRMHRIAMVDAYYENLVQLLYPELIEQHKAMFSYDEETEEELPDAEVEKIWAVEKLRYIAPQALADWERHYNIPEPLSHWDSRNTFQQYFIIESDTGTQVARGGYAGSGQRWDLGLMIHTFFSLHEKNIQIPTYILRYDSTNRLLIEEEHGTFRAVSPTYGCNYHTPREYSEKIRESGIIHTDKRYNAYED